MLIELSRSVNLSTCLCSMSQQTEEWSTGIAYKSYFCPQLSRNLKKKLFPCFIHMAALNLIVSISVPRRS